MLKIKSSLYHTFLLSVIGASFLMAAGIGYFWIQFEIREFDRDAQVMRDAYVAEQKNKVQNVVGQVVQYVNYRRATADEEIRRDIKERVDEALSICGHLYDQHHASKSREEVISLITESLRNIRFNHGRGYYFIYDMQGNTILLPNNPELEGKNLFNLQDDQGLYTVQRFIQLTREHGEGYLTWSWYKPGSTDKMAKKIGYAKSFQQLDWFVGTGEYVEDAEKEIQKEILAFISTIRFDNENYVFVYDFNAIALAHYKPTTVGTSLWDYVDPNGLKVAQEMIRISQQPGGGFLRYVGTVKPETGKPSAKIGYINSIPDWRWMIGAGVYVDDVEQVLNQRWQILQKEIKVHILNIGLICSLALTGIVLLTRIIFSRLKRNVEAFTSFFETAAVEAVRMDEKILHYTEFKHLAAPANRMIQERNKAQDALKESEERLNLALSATEQGLWDLNLENGSLIWDPRAFAIFGYVPFSITPSIKIIAARAHPEDWEGARRAMEEHISGGTKDYRAEYRMRAEDGSWTWVLDQGRITRRDEQGNALRAVGTYIDNTPAKTAEQEKNELREQLNRSKKMEALGLLAGGVAHDLNNVLSGIVSYPDLLLETLPADSSLRGPLITIRDSGNKAAAIVQDLLTLARRGVVTYDVVNLNRIIEEYLASPEYKHLLAHFPTTRVETRLDPALLNIKGSDVHLRKSLMNLVSNAFEAQPDGGHILIVTSNRYIEGPVRGYETILPGEYVLLRVEDFGTGIAAEDIKRIFEPFYTRKIMGYRSGTGLGMAIVWGTLQDHQGFIDVKSREGDGSQFELYFPVTREEPVSLEMAVSVDNLMGAGEHILVVDDIAEQRQVAKSILNRLGYQVTAVESGEAAIDYLQDHSADLLILDMIMDPGMDGLDTYRRIIEQHPGQKALITSGFAETDRVKEAQRLGVGRYLRKPYTFKGLGLAVHLELRGEQR
jgi:PAS domain S-box-containing protein